MAFISQSTFWSIAGIFVSGLCGGVAGWAAVTLADWSGTGAAIAAAAIGMLVATATWIGITVLLRAMKVIR